MLKEWTSRLTESAVTVKVLCLYTDMKKRKGDRARREHRETANRRSERIAVRNEREDKEFGKDMKMKSYGVEN